MKDFAEKVVDKIKSEPVRMRLYTIAAVVVAYLLATGVVSPTDADFIVTMVGLILSVETARAKVQPLHKRK